MSLYMYMYLPCTGLEEIIEQIIFQGVHFCAGYLNSVEEVDTLQMFTYLVL